MREFFELTALVMLAGYIAALSIVGIAVLAKVMHVATGI